MTWAVYENTICSPWTDRRGYASSNVKRDEVDCDQKDVDGGDDDDMSDLMFRVKGDQLSLLEALFYVS